MTWRKRALTAGAGVAVAALALAGCTTSGGTDEETASDGGTITIATTNAFTSFNGDTPDANLDTNGMIGYLTGVSGDLGLGGFQRLDSDYSVLPNEDFGTFEKISDDPLTVEYTLNEGLTWSDGEPITADDMLVNWVIDSGWFDDAIIDPATGDSTNGGTQYFTLAGSTAGLDTTSFPEISEDNMSMTLTYETPFVDWELVNPIGKPAHVIAEKAGVSLEEFIELINTLPEGNPEAPVAPNPTLQAAAEFWNTGYDVTAMPEDESLLVASGPFIVTDFVPESSITLEKNPEYKGDMSPAYDQLIVRFIGDANAQVTALQNGEVNAIQPQPSADTLTALENANATVIPGDQLAYDHLDLNFTGVFADPAVREAFLKTIPRQQILESMVTPVNPEAGVLNSQIFLPTDAEYGEAVSASGYDQFTEPDIEGAKALLAGATPTVRILYNTNNPNRVDSFRAIQQSAQEAGFIIEDAGSPDWSALLGSGSYDASIFGWVSPGAGNAALPQIFKTNGGGNYNFYSNPEVDALVDESQVTLDEDRLSEIKIEIDAATAADFYGLPLFQSPGLFADNGTVEGIEYFGGQTGIVWNAQEWTLAG
ncbi:MULTISPECIES: ABC transporter family substrate-binding protein [Microbacterium]|uniref:ABC transporter family substrate-binding protein n=1 Tax=Microbacterium wangchenii TaxID=2541726 RepID=A0ABX5STZ0_9MICO|nr:MULTISPECIES: ABC transporter family substrate-binding protein [Microbacterium]MCK6067836.1 ABC transporter family substrate-binding protein [Microbacterium sp. EYE_512]QBR89267.1 ABC transporter family substrate-binding protein [Microbacterium wangchenii]TFV81671.1 ABC transporter family substrate-binding protein [Microbacterium sp. dk485]TXK10940.1 ABC transporter family substrate-binding protein [Microbacterium wangchenii]